jgi:hypothetical protein
MVVKKNIIIISMFFFLFSIMLINSCSKSGSSSSPSDSANSNANAQNPNENQANLKVIIPVPQILALSGTNKEYTILVKNEGFKSASHIVFSGFEEPISLSNSKDANSCENKVLNNNETCELKIVFSPKKIMNGKKSISLSYTNDNDNKNVSIIFDINYLSKGSVNLFIPSVDQLKTSLTDAVSKTLTIKNLGEEEITGLKISKLEAPLVSDSKCPTTLQPGSTCNIDINFASNAVINGVKNLMITYDDLDLNSNESPITVIVPISYVTIGKSDISISNIPDALLSGANKTSERIYTIKNSGSAKATNIILPTFIKPLSNGGTTCTKELDSGDSCTFKVIFNPMGDSKIDQKDYYFEISFMDGIDIKKVVSKISFKSISNNILNLTQYNVSSASIQIDTPCNKKEIYGNGVHNIPLVPTFNATDENGRTISLSLDEIIAATQVQVVNGGISTDINTVKYTADKYSKCMDGTSVNSELKALFFTTSLSGQKLDIGAKITYIDKSGKTISVSTDNYQAGRVNINSLDNPLTKASGDSYFSMGIVSDKYIGSLITRDNYRLFKISPDTKNFPTLDGLSDLTQVRVTSLTYNKSSGLLKVEYTESQVPNATNYMMPIHGFIGAIKGDCMRRYYTGYFVSGKLKSNNIDIINVKKIGSYASDANLSLAAIGKNDFAFASITDSCLPGWVGNYQWSTPFTFEIFGLDSFGNPFKSINNSEF